jgi:hypothetical protein
MRTLKRHIMIQYMILRTKLLLQDTPCQAGNYQAQLSHTHQG